MAQPIRPAEIQMELVSQGTGMRNTTAPPGAQMQLDPTTNPMLSNQPFRQTQLAQQNVQQRGTEAMYQNLSGATRQNDIAITEAASSEQKARDFKRESVAMILDRSNAPATAMLFSDKGLQEQVTRDAMQMAAISQRLSPDLADYSGQLMA